MKLTWWYLGFNLHMAILCLLFGLGSYYFPDGWIHWILYILFVITLAFIVTKARLYHKEPWRRIHALGMHHYYQLLKGELESAKKENRDYNLPYLYTKLADILLEGEARTQFDKEQLLNDEQRKDYYRKLVADYPQAFTHQIKAYKHEEAIEAVLTDIKASELGPDIVIARAIESSYNSMEAARYLLALVTGVTQRNRLLL